MARHAVILAAGRGARLRPLTDVLPKPLLPVGGRPMLGLLVGQLAAAGFERVTITSHHLSEMIALYLPLLRARHPSLDVRHVPQATLMGTSGGLSSLQDLEADAPFLVMNSDLLCTLDYAALLDAHAQADAALTIATYSQAHQVRLGVLDVADGVVRAYHEKPTHTYTVSMGIYVFAPGTLAYVPPDGFQDAPDLVQALIADGLRVAAYPFDGDWLDMGTPEDYARAQAVFAEDPARFGGAG